MLYSIGVVVQYIKCVTSILGHRSSHAILGFDVFEGLTSHGLTVSRSRDMLIHANCSVVSRV